MDIISVLTTMAPIALAAAAAALTALAASVLLYSLYKKRGGKRNITKQQFLVGFLLLGWLAAVLGLTLFTRPAMFEGWFNFRLFSGYLNAWNNWSLSEFQLIIFNMLMFAPLGFLLPLLSKRMRRFFPVLLASLAVCVSVEALQMLTHRGVFELDDMFHNTLGSMIGYFLAEAILACLERKKLIAKPILRALIIPFAFVLLFCGALAVYNAKELGNLPIRPAIVQNMSYVNLELNIDLPNTAEPAALYRNERIFNLAYGTEQAGLLAKEFGLRQQGGMRTNGNNRIFLFQDDAGDEYSFCYSLPDGTWSLYCETGSPETGQAGLEEQAPRFEELFSENGLLPSTAVFSIQNADTLRWDAYAPQEPAQASVDYASGQIMIQPSVQASAPCDLFYAIAENTYIRQVDITTPEQAYAEIKNGQFEQYQDFVPGEHLMVNHYALTYVYDTKGYYQPAYQFEGTRNNEPWSCRIPAIG